MAFPVLTTDRLILRAFTLADIPALVGLAGAWAVARTTTVPHPYTEAHAREWLATQPSAFAKRERAIWAIAHRSEGTLMGAIELRFRSARHVGELGYWLGVSYWGQGIMTEAARAVLAYGFQEGGLYRIQARHWHTNPASGRVMEKIGMTYEGTLRAAAFRWGEYLDVLVYAVLKPAWEAGQSSLPVAGVPSPPEAR